jgi:hypothetical protein
MMKNKPAVQFGLVVAIGIVSIALVLEQNPVVIFLLVLVGMMGVFIFAAACAFAFIAIYTVCFLWLGRMFEHLQSFFDKELHDENIIDNDWESGARFALGDDGELIELNIDEKRKHDDTTN